MHVSVSFSYEEEYNDLSEIWHNFKSFSDLFIL